jgi:phosphatidylglycerol:prolipoprotein diacylglycerol transferase
MAIVTCIVHGFGRIGCFMAGCCYGKPTHSLFGVTFTNPVCQAEPLHTALHPTQLYEAVFIFILMTGLIISGSKKKFNGQLFLIYLITYAIGRGVLEIFRGDIQRGFLIENVISNSQVIALGVIVIAVYFYIRLKRKSNLLKH